MASIGEPLDVFEMKCAKMEGHFKMINLVLVCGTPWVGGQRSGRKPIGDLKKNPNEKQFLAATHPGWPAVPLRAYYLPLNKSSLCSLRKKKKK